MYSAIQCKRKQARCLQVLAAITSTYCTGVQEGARATNHKSSAAKQNHCTLTRGEPYQVLYTHVFPLIANRIVRTHTLFLKLYVALLINGN